MLYNLIESIRYLGVLLQPFMPSTAANMLAQIGVDGGLAAFASLRAGFGQMDAVRVNDRCRVCPAGCAKVLEEIRSEAEAAAQAAEKSEEHPENIAFLEQITIDDFARVDLRVAEITACEPVKKSKKLLKLTLNDGSDTPRIVCSGIARGMRRTTSRATAW